MSHAFTIYTNLCDFCFLGILYYFILEAHFAYLSIEITHFYYELRYLIKLALV